MIVGERLKALRKERKLSAEDLGAVIGVSRQQITRYEANQTDATTEVLLKIAEFFGVSTDYLLGRTNEAGEYSARVPFVWHFDVTYLIKRIPPERLARLVETFGVEVDVKNTTLDVKELLSQYPPAFVAQLMKEFGVEIKFKQD